MLVIDVLDRREDKIKPKDGRDKPKDVIIFSFYQPRIPLIIKPMDYVGICHIGFMGIYRVINVDRDLGKVFLCVER